MGPVKENVSAATIAKLAGVSTATVSRVIHGMPGVGSDTIARVKALIQHNNFKPQRVHRKKGVPSLSRKSVGSVAIVTLGVNPKELIEVPAYSAVLSGIERGAKQAKLDLTSCVADISGHLSGEGAKQKIRGAIAFVSGDFSFAQIESFFNVIQKKMPVVWVMGSEGMPSPADHVVPDNMGVGHLACRYLHDAGCKKVAYLAENARWPHIRLRGHGFIDSAYNFRLRATAYLCTSDDRQKSLYGVPTIIDSTFAGLIHRLAAAPQRPDGIFAATDGIAALAYPLLIETGIRVGRELRLVSCDNASVYLSKMKPRPATIDLGSQEIGYRAVFRLINRIERPGGPPLIIQVAPRLCLPA